MLESILLFDPTLELKSLWYELPEIATKGHMAVLGNICPFFERPELWFQASGTFFNNEC